MAFDNVDENTVYILRDIFVITKKKIVWHEYNDNN